MTAPPPPPQPRTRPPAPPSTVARTASSRGSSPTSPLLILMTPASSSATGGALARTAAHGSTASTRRQRRACSMPKTRTKSRAPAGRGGCDRDFCASAARVAGRGGHPQRDGLGQGTMLGGLVACGSGPGAGGPSLLGAGTTAGGAGAGWGGEGRVDANAVFADGGLGGSCGEGYWGARAVPYAAASPLHPPRLWTSQAPGLLACSLHPRRRRRPRTHTGPSLSFPAPPPAS
ncbi:hypothetical protein GSI_10848 [Ganoderma sinense ZZ0214-1]|uniref:Uncharacterized protein n=1 Tax=Ganoderma sinense ZZ0214-1 TaxID=1077348 RepID=A0A2G8S1Q7_9APHY|nr:hypothetical protein GSI_10848 [Ganoderma sinense ZZ0214-1]